MITETKGGMISLRWVWGVRLRLYVEGNKLWVEGNKLRVEGNKLWAEGNRLWVEGDKLYAAGSKLYAEGDKLKAEGDKLYAAGTKLRAEGDKLWVEAVMEALGNVRLSWINWNEKYRSFECRLENGEVFGFELEKEK